MKPVYGFSEATFSDATTQYSVLMQAIYTAPTRTDAHFESNNFSNGSGNLLNQSEFLVGIWKGPEAFLYT